MPSSTVALRPTVHLDTTGMLTTKNHTKTIDGNRPAMVWLHPKASRAYSAEMPTMSQKPWMKKAKSTAEMPANCFAFIVRFVFDIVLHDIRMPRAIYLNIVHYFYINHRNTNDPLSSHKEKTRGRNKTGTTRRQRLTKRRAAPPEGCRCSVRRSPARTRRTVVLTRVRVVSVGSS